MDFEVVVKASRYFEAAFKTAVVLHEQRVKESLLKVKRQNGDSFDYHITSSRTHNGFVYPSVLCVRVRCTTVEYAVKTSEVLHTTALLVSLFNVIYSDIYSGVIT